MGDRMYLLLPESFTRDGTVLHDITGCPGRNGGNTIVLQIPESSESNGVRQTLSYWSPWSIVTWGPAVAAAGLSLQDTLPKLNAGSTVLIKETSFQRTRHPSPKRDAHTDFSSFTTRQLDCLTNWLPGSSRDKTRIVGEGSAETCSLSLEAWWLKSSYTVY